MGISQEVFMARFKWVLAVTFLVLGQAALAADDDIENDDTLSPEQKKQLKQVQEDFTALTKKTDKSNQEKQDALKSSLRTVLAQKSQPSDMSINGLAGTMAGYVGDGALSVRDSTLITKKLTQFLEKGDFSLNSNRGLVKDMEKIVQGGLGQDDRNRLYNSILTVVNTADGNARKK